MNILVVDDNHMLARILADHLAGQGHSVQPVFDGAQALRFFSRAKYDLIIIDLVMPEMDGVTLLQEIRKQDKGSCIIIISGFLQLLRKEASEFRALGAQAVVEKPFSFADIDTVVARCEKEMVQRRGEPVPN